MIPFHKNEFIDQVRYVCETQNIPREKNIYTPMFVASNLNMRDLDINDPINRVKPSMKMSKEDVMNQMINSRFNDTDVKQWKFYNMMDPRPCFKVCDAMKCAPEESFIRPVNSSENREMDLTKKCNGLYRPFNSHPTQANQPYKSQRPLDPSFIYPGEDVDVPCKSLLGL